MSVTHRIETAPLSVRSLISQPPTRRQFCRMLLGGALIGFVVGLALAPIARAADRPSSPVSVSPAQPGPVPAVPIVTDASPQAASSGIPGPGWEGDAQYGPGQVSVTGPGWEGLAQYGPQAGEYEGRSTYSYAATYATEQAAKRAEYEAGLCSDEQAAKPWIAWGCSGGAE